MANTMRILKKVEAPRPLKSQMVTNSIKVSQDAPAVTADSLISLAENFARMLVTKSTDAGLHNNLKWLRQQLQTHGPRLEINYRDPLNKIFVIFRNESQNGDINYNIRLTLLQLIELRANNWICSDGAQSYYEKKDTHNQESTPLEGLVLSPSPEPFSVPVSPAPSLLAPGEVVRTSGKYNRPTKIPGKNYTKDEVVIRNADSGKVNPGAKDSYAKQLMEDTIRRNASPVRSSDVTLSGLSLSGAGDCDQDSGDSLGSLGLDEITRPRSLRHSRSVNDASEEGGFSYTVHFPNGGVVKITGTSLFLVTASKLELEKLAASPQFNACNNSNLSDLPDGPDEVFLNDPSPSSPISEEIATGYGNGFEIPPEPVSSPDEVAPRVVIERRKYFSRKSLESKEDPVPNEIVKYTPQMLIDYSQSGPGVLSQEAISVLIKNNIYKKQVNAVQRWYAATNKTSLENNKTILENNNSIPGNPFHSYGPFNSYQSNNHLNQNQSVNNNTIGNGCVHYMNGN